MAEKKNEDGSQCLSDENILGRKKKKPFKGKDILTLILHLLIILLFPQNHTVYYFLTYLCYHILN